VQFGISPFAVWRNKATDPTGSDTAALAESYDDLYADARKWVRREWIDYVAPTVFWNIGFGPADYAKLIPWWSAQVAGTDVQLFIGQATYKVGTSTQDPAWSDPREITRHLFFNRAYLRVRGDIYFSGRDLLANRLDNMGIVVADHYTRPALVPVVTRLHGPAPSRPVLVGARRGPRGVRLVWHAGRTSTRRPSSYAIYRFAGARRVRACDVRDARHLLATARAGSTRSQSFLDVSAKRGLRYTYAVAALDRMQHESRPSAPRTVRR
jgi:hypothetical protein